MSTELRRSRPVQHIGPRQTLGAWLRDLWAYRNVLAALFSRELRGKYKQASLGIAWAFIQPLVQVAIFTLVFRGVARIETPVPYVLFVLAALLPFNLFQQIITLGTPAFVNANAMVTKVYFPRIYTILAAGSSSLPNAAVTAVVLIVAMVAYQARFPPTILLAVPLLGAVVLLAVGVASLLGALNARYRDVQHALPLLMTVLMYVSPVLYPIERIPAWLRPYALLNPVTGLIDGFRGAVTGQAPYSWTAVGAAALASIAVFLVGLWVFERTQAKLIDVL